MNKIDEGQKKTLTILWMALTGSIFIYGLVGYISQQNVTHETPIDQTTLIVLGIAAAMVVGAVFFVIPKAIKPKTKAHLFSFCIIQWALIEAIAVLGLLSYFLGGPLSIFLTFLGAATIFMVVLLPTEIRLNELLREDIY